MLLLLLLLLLLLTLLLPLLLKFLLTLLLILLLLPSLSPGFNSRLVHQVYDWCIFISGIVPLASSFVHQVRWTMYHSPSLVSHSPPGRIPLQFSLQHWNLTSPPYLIILHILVIHHPQPFSFGCSSSHREKLSGNVPHSTRWYPSHPVNSPTPLTQYYKPTRTQNCDMLLWSLLLILLLPFLLTLSLLCCCYCYCRFYCHY